VEKLLRGGVHTASWRVKAEVCQRCGERYYAPDIVRRFEEIRAKLARQETAEFQPVGHSFQVPKTKTNKALHRTRPKVCRERIQQ